MDQDFVQAGIERRAAEPAERLLAIFDVFDEWFRRSDFNPSYNPWNHRVCLVPDADLFKAFG